MSNPIERLLLLEACVKGINTDVIKISARIRKIESILNDLVETKESVENAVPSMRN